MHPIARVRSLLTRLLALGALLLTSACSLIPDLPGPIGIPGI